MEKEKSAGAVIFRLDNGCKYLLLHYEAGHWDFPKGNIEKGEEEKETVQREVEEETGIKDIKFIESFKEKIHYFYRLKGKLISKEVIFYLAKANTSAIKLSFEHIGFEWLPYEEAMDRLTFKTARDILKKTNDFLKTHKTVEDFY